MNYLFFLLIVSSIFFAIYNNSVENLVKSMLVGCDLAVKISFSLIGIMCFWLGVMRIAEKSGMIVILSKLLHPIMKLLFQDIDKSSPVLGNISMSIGANALGLTNAATPIGLKVMKELQEVNSVKDTASDSMCMFLAMNTAGFQIIPMTVIAILAGLGASNPTQTILPTLIVTALSFIIAILLALVFKTVWIKKGEKL